MQNQEGKKMKTVEIKELPHHHSGISVGYMVASTVLPNCKRRVSNEKEATELARYWEQVAMAQYA